MKCRRKKHYRLKLKSFIRRFIFWLLCILIDIFPIFLKKYQNVSPKTFKGVGSLIYATIGDLDFLFVTVDVILILCIEGFFADGEIIDIYRKIRVLAVFYGFVITCIYLCLIFKPEMFIMMGSVQDFWLNVILISLTIIIGFLCNVTISLEEGV